MNINKRKIIAMTKAAQYDKNYGTSDKHILRFFRQDYSYRKNMWTRFYAIIALLCWYTIYWFNQIAVKGVDVFGLDYKAELWKMGIEALVVLFAVSVIGTLQAGYAWNAAQKRQDEYIRQLNRADRFDGEVDEQYRAQDGTGRVSDNDADFAD